MSLNIDKIGINEATFSIELDVKKGNANAFGHFIRNQILKFGKSWKIVGYSINPELSKTTVLSSEDYILEDQTVVSCALALLKFESNDESEFKQIEITVNGDCLSSDDIKDSNLKCKNENHEIMHLLKSEVKTRIILYLRNDYGKFTSSQNSTFLKNQGVPDINKINVLTSTHAPFKEITFDAVSNSYDTDKLILKVFDKDIKDEEIKRVLDETLNGIQALVESFKNEVSKINTH